MAEAKTRTAVAEYVAECFWPGVTKDDVLRLDRRALKSASARRAMGTRVRYLGSLLLPTDEVVFCFFAGPSADAVDRAARRARIPFDRILRSIRVRAVSRA